MKEYSKNLTDIEVGAIQWRECLEAVKNFVAGTDLHYHEVKYENLINEPDDHLSLILNF